MQSIEKVIYLADSFVSYRKDFNENHQKVGISLGAVVASVVAATHPQLVNRLVLTAPWATNDDPYFQLMFTTWLKLENSDQTLATAFGLSHVLSPEFISSLGKETLRQICARPSEKGANRRIALGLSINIKNYLSRINKDALIIGLSHDTLIPPYLAREVHKSIKNSLYTEVKSGHAVQMENPAEWVKVIKDFLQK